MSFHQQLSSKIKSFSEISRYVNALRLTGKKVVFTNGCFDILHKGHVDYLAKARDLGGLLVVGLNSDDSVKRLNKGSNRPINNQEARASVLASLGCIDAVVIFEEDTPLELIKEVHPDVLVKGGDYQAENVVGHKEVIAWGGEVKIIPFTEGYSTSTLIEKIKG